MDLINHLMRVEAMDIFTPPAVYDDRKNMFAPRELHLGPNGSQEFNVSLSDDVNRGNPGENTGRCRPKIYKIQLTKVATINPEVLQCFILGQQSHDNMVLTALMSVQPAIGCLLINVNISMGTMYKAGPLTDLCLDSLGRPGQLQLLSPKKGMPDRERIRLQQFIAGIWIITMYTGQCVWKTPHVIKKLSTAGANSLSFTMHDSMMMTIAQYFHNILNRPLTFPDNIHCIEVVAAALIPVELCVVPKGQIMQKQVPPEKMKDVLEFAMKNPHDHLASITSGLAVLVYGQSQYMHEFRMHVDDTVGPINLLEQVLPPPRLRYSQGSPQPVVTPANGAWNMQLYTSSLVMVDKRFFHLATINHWIMVIYEHQQCFTQQSAQDMINGLVQCCCNIGMRVNDTNPMVTWQNSQGHIADQLCQRPMLIIVILPDNANDIYTAVGVATQCMKSSKCYQAKVQYYVNVCLKINVKLGSINTIPDSKSISILMDPWNMMIVMDSNTMKYITTCHVQTSQKEIIEDLREMAQDLFKEACKRLSVNPKITMIVIGKCHHVHFFTWKLPCWMVIDQVVAHLVEFNWYLLSHGDLLGTSQPVHYTMLYDDNNFQANSLQLLAFALCHVYMRSTHSVSIPAPVYYPDIICSQAKNHYDPQAGINLSDMATHTDTMTIRGALKH
ncbi:argonaute-like protein [Pisolithus marmoratus]|nr:argonaute-like protein [Pisolithus marmoratus]